MASGIDARGTGIRESGEYINVKESGFLQESCCVAVTLEKQKN
jgi:hypothetical protein